LVTDGAFRTDGTFLLLGYHEIEVLTGAFRRAVLRQFVRSELLSEDEAHSMLGWPHSGFHVHHGVRIDPDDALGLLQVARYAARAPIAPERLSYDASRGTVTRDLLRKLSATKNRRDINSSSLPAPAPTRFWLPPREAMSYPFCREIGEPPAAVALAWLLRNPAVTAPIIGPRTVEQLEGSLRALEIKLPDEIAARLDEIWPGPKGEAPEAYAW